MVPILNQSHNRKLACFSKHSGSINPTTKKASHKIWVEGPGSKTIGQVVRYSRWFIWTGIGRMNDMNTSYWLMQTGVLPVPAILRSAFKQEEGFETVDLSVCPETPPLVLREDLYDVQFITQEEFLEATDRRIQREYDEYFACIDDPWRDIDL